MQRTPDERRWVEAVIASHPKAATDEDLAQRFRQIFEDRDSDGLKGWLARSVASQITELKRFVTGLQRDYEAVTASIQQHWSNGQVQGQVHRLKLLKRQMYGRSGFPLLQRQRRASGGSLAMNCGVQLCLIRPGRRWRMTSSKASMAGSAMNASTWNGLLRRATRTLNRRTDAITTINNDLIADCTIKHKPHSQDFIVPDPRVPPSSPRIRPNGHPASRVRSAG
jgi:hypothetical protein